MGGIGIFEAQARRGAYGQRIGERLLEFTAGEQQFLNEVWARTGLPTDNFKKIYPFSNHAQLQANGIDTRGLIADPAGLYDHSSGKVFFQTYLFVPSHYKLKFNGVEYAMTWYTSETLVHELAHGCSPAIYSGSARYIAANKRRYYGGEEGRVGALNLLERMSQGMISQGQKVNDYHIYNYEMYRSGQMLKEQYLDEVFAIFVQFMFTRVNFLEYKVRSGSITRADADALYRIVAKIIGCTVSQLHERMLKTAEMATNEASYFKQLGIGRAAA